MRWKEWPRPRGYAPGLLLAFSGWHITRVPRARFWPFWCEKSQLFCAHWQSSPHQILVSIDKIELWDAAQLKCLITEFLSYFSCWWFPAWTINFIILGWEDALPQKITHIKQKQFHMAVPFTARLVKPWPHSLCQHFIRLIVLAISQHVGVLCPEGQMWSRKLFAVPFSLDVKQFFPLCLQGKL